MHTVYPRRQTRWWARLRFAHPTQSALSTVIASDSEAIQTASAVTIWIASSQSRCAQNV
jgi:hypothetical protein